jgi:predicted O-methyltransferase YrrM
MMITRHEHTFLTLEATREDKRLIMPYQKTYPFPGPFINQTHHRLALSALHNSSDLIDVGIEGWLFRADALKLYEMAYYCGGDILELGTYKGLSTSIMAEASWDSERNFAIVSVDLNPELSLDAQRGMEVRETPGRQNIHFFVFDAITFVANLAARRT